MTEEDSLKDESTKAEKHRFSAILTAQERDDVKATAARRGTTVTAAFDRAVRMLGFVDSALAEGCEIVSVDKDGKETKLVFLL